MADEDTLRLEGVLTGGDEGRLRLYVDDVLEEFIEFPEAGTIAIEPLPREDDDFVQAVVVTLAAAAPTRRGRMDPAQAEHEARVAIEPEEQAAGGMRIQALGLSRDKGDKSKISRGCTGPISDIICPSSKCTDGRLCHATEHCTNDAYCPVPTRVRRCDPDTSTGPC
ncbi:MAG TPA: hypothetical protein VF517_04150 [Thermoleophilaceae bacterium]|jgi:hypothetical protein